MSLTRSSSTSPSSNTTNRRPDADIAASTSSTFIRPKRLPPCPPGSEWCAAQPAEPYRQRTPLEPPVSSRRMDTQLSSPLSQIHTRQPTHSNTRTHAYARPHVNSCRPFAGGRIYELSPDGTEHEWGEICVWDPPRRVEYWWHIFLDRDMATMVSISFTPSELGTSVRLENSGFEVFGDGVQSGRSGSGKPGRGSPGNTRKPSRAAWSPPKSPPPLLWSPSSDRCALGFSPRRETGWTMSMRAPRNPGRSPATGTCLRRGTGSGCR